MCSRKTCYCFSFTRGYSPLEPWMRVPCLLVLITFGLWPLRQPFYGTGPSPRCLRPRLGGQIGFSPPFISVTFLIRWIHVTLWGPLSLGFSFKLSAIFVSLRFRVFSYRVHGHSRLCGYCSLPVWYIYHLPEISLHLGLTYD